MTERKEVREGQAVRVFDRDRPNCPPDGYPGRVGRAGAGYAVISWPGGRGIFKQETGKRLSNPLQYYRVEADTEKARSARALETLRQYGLGPLGWGRVKASLEVLEAAAEAVLVATEDL